MATSTTSTPHDAVFKQFLCHPDTARDFLEIHLPTTLRQICNLNTLRLESGSFIEEDLRPHYSDILWSLETSEGEGYIYVVIEHQSTPDAHMAFRLMRYAMAAMQRHLEAGHKTLPLVVPMLFYHGNRSPYPFSLCWLDEFADPVMARKLYATAFPSGRYYGRAGRRDYATPTGRAAGTHTKTHPPARSDGACRTAGRPAG